MLNEKELLNARFGKESRSISNVEVDAVCRKLRELGVEVIERFPDKIEFEWMGHICTYKNRTIYCGTKGMTSIGNISRLNTDNLDCLVGKLTDEQLTRVGNLIDLIEGDIDHIISQQEDMKYIDMFGTKLYQKNEQLLVELTNLIEELQKAFQSGFRDEPFNINVLRYILKGE